MIKYGRTARLAASVFALAQMAVPQQEPTTPLDIFSRPVAGVALKDQSIIDGIAMLSQVTGLPVSVEFPLGISISGQAPPLRTLTTNVGPGTLTEVLDRLCSMDPTFTWIRNGNMLNVVPRSIREDPRYVLNRRVHELTFQDLAQASDAVMKMVDQLPGPREQLAVLQVGIPLNFSQPWRATFKDVTVREAINQIAQQLGPAYGWQFSGAQDFRIITFHEGISPKPSRSKQQNPDRG